MELARGGLWRPGSHRVIIDRYDYPAEVTCTQYVVADDDGLEAYRMWFRDYAPATLAPVRAAAGLDIQELWGSLTGTPYDSASDWFAVVAGAVTTEASADDE